MLKYSHKTNIKVRSTNGIKHMTRRGKYDISWFELRVIFEYVFYLIRMFPTKLDMEGAICRKTPIANVPGVFILYYFIFGEREQAIPLLILNSWNYNPLQIWPCVFYEYHFLNNGTLIVSNTSLSMCLSRVHEIVYSYMLWSEACWLFINFVKNLLVKWSKPDD